MQDHYQGRKQGRKPRTRERRSGRRCNAPGCGTRMLICAEDEPHPASCRDHDSMTLRTYP